MMNQEVASEVQTSSFSNGAHRSVSFKHNNKNVKKNSIYIKKPKNSMDKLLEAFSEDLKKAIKNHELLQGSFMKVDQYMQKVKKELTDNADLLLLHKGLVKRLQQFQTDRHPIILKIKNILKIQKKYVDYLDSIDSYRDTIGKLKLQSIKFKERLEKWKEGDQHFTHLLNDIIADDSIMSLIMKTNCIVASSSTTNFTNEDYDDSPLAWIPVTPNIKRHKCRFVHHERKPHAAPHFPTCPIEHPKRTFKENYSHRQCEIPMETPMIDENSSLSKKISELQLEMKNYQNGKQIIEENITHLYHEIESLLQQDIHYDTINDAHRE